MCLKGRLRVGRRIESALFSVVWRSPALTRLWTAAWTAGRLILNELWIARIEVACTNNHT